MGYQVAVLVERPVRDRPHPEQGYRSALGVLSVDFHPELNRDGSVPNGNHLPRRYAASASRDKGRMDSPPQVIRDDNP
jgi:hypothetical protein